MKTVRALQWAALLLQILVLGLGGRAEEETSPEGGECATARDAPRGGGRVAVHPRSALPPLLPSSTVALRGEDALIETYRGESYGTRIGLSFAPFGRARLCCAGADRISAVLHFFPFCFGDWPKGCSPSAPLALVSLALLGFHCLVCNGRFFPPCVAQDCTPLATLLPFPKSAGL